MKRTLLALSVLAGLLPLFAQGRLIGVVYDNSTSMTTGNRHEATAYSFKLMSALMVPGDTLAIYTLTMVSRGAGEPRRFPQERLEDLRRWIDRIDYNSRTPFEPVNVMLRYLQKQGNPHKSIVVFTDGAFLDDLNSDYIRSSDSESGIKASYLILNPDAGERQYIISQDLLPLLLRKFNGSDQRGGYFVEDAAYGDLPGKMGALFTFVNDLSSEGQSDYIRIVGADVHVSSPFPLKTVRMIYQTINSPAIRLKQVSMKYVAHLNEYSLTTPEQRRIAATAGFIELELNGADSTTFTLSFDQAIQPNNLFLLLDTDLELYIEPLLLDGSRVMFRNGQYAVGNTDSLKLQVYFKSEGVKFRFHPALQQKLRLSAQIRDGRQLRLSSGDGIDFYTAPFTLGSGKGLQRIIDVFAKYPGHFSFQKSLLFALDKIKTILLVNGSKEPVKLWDAVSHCDLSRIRPMRICILSADGDSLTDQYDIKVSTAPDLRKIESSQGQTLALTFDNYLFPWKDPVQSVTVTVDGTPRTSLYSPLHFSTRIEINRGPWWCRWIYFIVLLLLIMLVLLKIWCLMRTSRFKRQARIFKYDLRVRSSYKQNPLETMRLWTFWSYLFSLLLCHSQKKLVMLGGKRIILCAGPGGILYVNRKSAKGCTEIEVDGENLDSLSAQGMMPVAIMEDSRLQTSDRKYSYEYSRLGIRR